MVQCINGHRASVGWECLHGLHCTLHLEGHLLNHEVCRARFLAEMNRAIDDLSHAFRAFGQQAADAAATIAKAFEALPIRSSPSCSSP